MGALVKYARNVLSVNSPLPPELGEFKGARDDHARDTAYSLGGALTAALATALASRKVFNAGRAKSLRNAAISIFPGVVAGEALKKYNS